MKRIVIAIALTALLLAPAQVAHADDGNSNDRLIIGQDFTLSAGQTLDGDLVVIGGTATIEYGGLVRGDIVVIGGSLRLDGETAGAAVVIGGAASIGERAAVGSDLIAVGGNLQQLTGARIGGDVITTLQLPPLPLPHVWAPSAPPTPMEPPWRFGLGPFGAAAAVLFQAIGLAALAMLLTAFLHPQLDRVAQALVSQPFMVGSIGLLVVFVTPLAVIVLAITLILIPVALAAVILLVLAWLFGVVALGMVLGDRLTQAVHRSMEPVLSAGLGALALAVVVGTVQQLPCVGWIAPALVGLLGLGAAVMTAFGTRPMTRVTAPVLTADGGGSGPAPSQPAA